jgi:hypothetical protein
LQTFIIYARSFDLTRPRVYNIEHGVAHWGRHLRFGAIPPTSVRAFTLFKYAIKVTGATSFFTAPSGTPSASPGTDSAYSAHRRQFHDAVNAGDASAVILDIANAYVHTDLCLNNDYATLDNASAFNCAAWRNAARDEHDRPTGNASCCEEYVSALRALTNIGDHFVGVVTYSARALDGAYALTADGVLKFYGTFPRDLPMYMLFLMILGAAGALGAIINILDQGGQLDRAFGRPLAGSEQAWLAESLRSLQHARHSLYTLAGLLRPNTTRGGYSDNVPAVLHAAALRLINGFATAHASALPERPDFDRVDTDSSDSDASGSDGPPCDPCSPGTGDECPCDSTFDCLGRKYQERLAPKMVNKGNKMHFPDCKLVGGEGFVDSDGECVQDDAPAQDSTAEQSTASVPGAAGPVPPGHKIYIDVVEPHSPPPPPPPPSPSPASHQSPYDIDPRITVAAKFFVEHGSAIVANHFSGDGLGEHHRRVTRAAAGSMTPDFTCAFNGDKLTLTKLTLTPMTKVTLWSVMNAGPTFHAEHLYHLDFRGDDDGNPVSITCIEVGVVPGMVPTGYCGRVPNVFQAMVDVAVYGTQYKFVGVSSNVLTAIDSACHKALDDARTRYPSPIRPLTTQRDGQPSIASVQYPVQAACDHTFGSTGHNLAITFDQTRSKFVVHPNVVDPEYVATATLGIEYDIVQQFELIELAEARANRRGRFALGICQSDDGGLTPTVLSGGAVITGPKLHEHNFASISWKRVRQHNGYHNLAILDPHGRWHVFYNIVDPFNYYKAVIAAHETACARGIAELAARVQCGSHEGADFCDGCPAIYWTEHSTHMHHYNTVHNAGDWRPAPVHAHRPGAHGAPSAGSVPPPGSVIGNAAGAPNILHNPNVATGRQHPGLRRRPARHTRNRHRGHRSFKPRAEATAVRDVKFSARSRHRGRRSFQPRAEADAVRDVKVTGNIQTAALTVIAMVSVFTLATHMLYGYVLAGALALAVLLASAYPVHQLLQPQVRAPDVRSHQQRCKPLDRRVVLTEGILSGHGARRRSPCVKEEPPAPTPCSCSPASPAARNRRTPPRGA